MQQPISPNIRTTPALQSSRGLTVLELLLGVAILGIIASLALPGYREYARRVTTGVAIADIRQIEQSIERYRVLHNRYPESLGEAGIVPSDPWGRAYQYLNIETARNRGQVRKDRRLVPLNTDYDLYSMGEDGLSRPPLTASQSHDDIVRANNGRFVGLAKDY